MRSRSNFRDHAPLFRFGAPRQSRLRLAARRNGCVMSYGSAPISDLPSEPMSRRGRGLVSLLRLLFVLLCLAGAGGGEAVAEDVPFPQPRPAVWLEPHTFREAAGPDFNSTEVTNASTECDQRL